MTWPVVSGTLVEKKKQAQYQTGPGPSSAKETAGPNTSIYIYIE